MQLLDLLENASVDGVYSGGRVSLARRRAQPARLSVREEGPPPQVLHAVRRALVYARRGWQGQSVLRGARQLPRWDRSAGALRRADQVLRHAARRLQVAARGDATLVGPATGAEPGSASSTSVARTPSQQPSLGGPAQAGGPGSHARSDQSVGRADAVTRTRQRFGDDECFVHRLDLQHPNSDERYVHTEDNWPRQLIPRRSRARTQAGLRRRPRGLARVQAGVRGGVKKSEGRGGDPGPDMAGPR